jgi:hypothetical protein
VDAVGGALTEAREALLGIGLPPSPDRLEAALAAHRERRRQQLRDGAAEPRALQAGVSAVAVAVAVAEAAHSLVLTVRGAVGAPLLDPVVSCGSVAGWR